VVEDSFISRHLVQAYASGATLALSIIQGGWLLPKSIALRAWRKAVRR
jgi:hypothetical protein